MDDGIFRFFATVFQLPWTLAEAGGFESVVMIVDNFDESDDQIIPKAPFENAHSFVYVHEFLKLALENTNFIVAAHVTERFMQVMSPTESDSVDLLSGIDLASTIDVEDQGEPDSGDRFAAHIDDSTFPLELNELMCGGVVHYLVLWRELCEIMSGLEAQQPGDEFDDLQLKAIAAAQDLVDLFYVPEEKEFRVTNVVRIGQSTEF
jgi:hypothetical protein